MLHVILFLTARCQLICSCDIINYCVPYLFAKCGKACIMRVASSLWITCLIYCIPKHNDLFSFTFWIPNHIRNCWEGPFTAYLIMQDNHHKIQQLEYMHNINHNRCLNNKVKEHERLIISLQVQQRSSSCNYWYVKRSST